MTAIVELRALLKTALEVANEIGAGEDSRSSSPVAPDGPDPAVAALPGTQE